jgi:hypothetical protein
MRRSTLDKFFVVGGILLAGLLLVLGIVLKSNANFANDYVKDQLGAQQINFTPVEGLSDEEVAVDCLKDNAGEALTTGKQAECYANEYIGLHLTEINEGKTYSQTSGAARAARAEADAAEESGAANAEELAATATELEGKVQALFRGETLRGLLLTSYGFSEFGRKADQAAAVSFLAALVLLLASLAGAVHAARAPKSAVVE